MMALSGSGCSVTGVFMAVQDMAATAASEPQKPPVSQTTGATAAAPAHLHAPAYARHALALAIAALAPPALILGGAPLASGLPDLSWAALVTLTLLTSTAPIVMLWRMVRRVDSLAARLGADLPTGNSRRDPLARIDAAVAALERRIHAMEAHGDPARRDDPTTGLPNRQTAMRRARDEITRARRKDEPLAVALIALDIGPPSDDTLERGRQDRALRLTAELLMQGLRAYDVVGRWTHDLFVAILPEAEIEHAVSAVERVRQMAQDGNGIRRGEPLPALHGGVAVLQHDDATLTEIAERASRALDRARSGIGAAVQAAPGPRSRPARLAPV
jgi:diguanylate cyclase (GGDEF)-like protein